MVGFRVLTHVARSDMICNEFAHSREIEMTLERTEGSVYPKVAGNDGVVVGRYDFLDAVFRDDDFVVCPQSTVLEVLTFVVIEFASGGVEEVGEDFGVPSVVVHPIV